MQLMNKRFIIACLYFLLLVAIVCAQEKVTITVRVSSTFDTTTQQTFTEVWTTALSDNGCAASFFSTNFIFYNGQIDSTNKYRVDIVTDKATCQSIESIYKAEPAASNALYSALQIKQSLYAIDGAIVPTIYPAVIKCDLLTSSFEQKSEQFWISTDRAAALGEVCSMNITPQQSVQNQGATTFTQTFNLDMEGDDITRCQLATLMPTFGVHAAYAKSGFDTTQQKCQIVSYGPTPYPNSLQCAGVQDADKQALLAAAFDVVGQTTKCYPRLPVDGAQDGVVNVYLESETPEENYCATNDPQDIGFALLEATDFKCIMQMIANTPVFPNVKADIQVDGATLVQLMSIAPLIEEITTTIPSNCTFNGFEPNAQGGIEVSFIQTGFCDVQIAKNTFALLQSRVRQTIPTATFTMVTFDGKPVYADGPYDIQLRCGKDKNEDVKKLLNLMMANTAQNQECSFVHAWYDATPTADEWSLLAKTSAAVYTPCSATQVNTIWNAALQQLLQSEQEEEKNLYFATNCWIYEIADIANYNTKQLDNVVFTLKNPTQDGMIDAHTAIVSYAAAEKKNPSNSICLIDSFNTMNIYSNFTHIVGNFTVAQPTGVVNGCTFDALLSNLELFVDDNETMFDDVERFIVPPIPDDKDPGDEDTKDPIDPVDPEDGDTKDPLDPEDGDTKDPLDPDGGENHQGNSAMSQQIVSLSLIIAMITTTTIAMM